ncbi:MAG: sensor histidine kinase [Chryseobacterium sp.]|nr:sensor histidine kinase [Chryseobacterium sp.]
MKLFYRLLVFCLLLSGHIVLAQDISVAKEIKKIDSLIDNYQFVLAEKKADSLYKTKIDKNQFLEVRFRQALLLDKQEESSVESLKVLLSIIDDAENTDLHSLSCRIYLLTALAYEKAQNFELTNLYLNKAYKTYKAYHLEELYSTYCIRRSSYYRFINKFDLMYSYARQAEKYAEKYQNKKDLEDSYLLMGVYMSKNKNYAKTLEYSFKILKLNKKNYHRSKIALDYNNISYVYVIMKDYPKALLYSDSAYVFYNDADLMYKDYLSESRYKAFEGLGNTDSAYHYFKQYHDNIQVLTAKEEKLKIKKLENQYQSDKREDTIKDKDNQMILIGSLLAVIAIASILLFGKNRQINHRNKIINQQLGELTQLLKQKQFLLSELQHRVKNNLQHVISILEIQKESADFNNIEELIRGNQNRIHSMALLHKKLNVSDNVNDVDFTRYITELSEIVKESYDNHQKKINLNINCEIETITIGKALPIGFIIVELISNSMKHAFKNRNIGIINIEITEGKNGQKNKFYYSDNGDGFDFNQTNEKGLGLEITKGLIDQIDGIVETKTDNGFELIIYFK